MVEKINTLRYRNIEIEEKHSKLDLSILKKHSNSKTLLGLILSYAKLFKKQGNQEMTILFTELYKKGYNLQKSEKIRIESWRGKSGIKVWNKPDSIVVEFAGKRDLNDKPNIQTKEYSKQDINKMILCINKLKEKYKNRIPSRELGGEFYGGDWDSRVFTHRTDHMKFTHLLGILDYYNIIRYNRRGFTSVIKEVREIQEVLK